VNKSNVSCLIRRRLLLLVPPVEQGTMRDRSHAPGNHCGLIYKCNASKGMSAVDGIFHNHEDGPH
jgi:hypothetical protein